MFIIINTYKYDSIFSHEITSYLQPFLHERQPFAVPEHIVGANETVVVDEILVAGIVRRINVDDVDHAPVRFLEKLERGEVVAFDEEVDVSPVVDESLGDFGEHGEVVLEFHVDAFLVFLEDEAVFLLADFLLEFRRERDEPRGVGVGGVLEE